MVRVCLLSLALCCACAATTRTCPIGTTLVKAHEPRGRAQWCAVDGSATTSLPTTGRSFEGAIALVQPTAMPGGVAGPYTSWYADGTLQSHGSYANYGARSVPEGIWAFWYPSGQRRVLGEYKRGMPTGCFATWDEAGTRRTGTVEGDQLRVSPCTPPDDDEIAAVESGSTGAPAPPAWGDLSLQAMAGPNDFGAAHETQVTPNPSTILALGITGRKHYGRFRVGPTFGARLSSESNYRSLAVGGSAAWVLPSFHRRIETELSADLALERMSVTAQRQGVPGEARLNFMNPRPALQLSLALALSPNVQALVAARVDGLPTRDVESATVYCDFGCAAPVMETWQIGGISYGAVLGLRLVAR